MEIKITENISIDTDEYSDGDLRKLHAYYYQQGLKVTAQKCLDAIEERSRKTNIEIDEDYDN